MVRREAVRPISAALGQRQHRFSAAHCGSLALTLAAFSSQAFAEGVQVPSHGARAGAQGDAYVAQADDPSAIYYNPAGLTQVPGTQVAAGLFTGFPGFEFNGPAGHRDMDQLVYIPQVYATTDAGTKDWCFGLGFNTAFGVSEDWGSQGPFRTIVTSADLTVLSVTPAVACKVNDHLSLGAGLDIYRESAAPDRTFTPLVVDLASHVLTAGVGYGQPGWEVDLAYRYILGVDRQIDNSINSPPGEYSESSHVLMASLTLRF